MIKTTEAKSVARELHARYDHARALTLIGRTLMKALFGGRADEVIFWALVHAHYCGGELCPAIEKQIEAFDPFILRDPSPRQ